MRESHNSHEEEFQKLTGDITSAMGNVQDSIAMAQLLYTIAEEKKSNNILIKDIQGKFDNILVKLERFEEILVKLEELVEILQETRMHKPDPKTITDEPNIEPSEKDLQVLDFVEKQGRVCAEDLQEKFEYKGRNAASARLSKLFRDGYLQKTYQGRKVYYTHKT
ncbi:MAG: hypothetical protein ABH950_04490 [Candidatus Altiarchaeota archaeon]